MPIAISAIVCTHNRADFVVKAIKSLAAQTLNNDDYEILVIDNGSKDDTQKLVENERLTVSNLRYIYEPRANLSHARNLGLTSSRGDILAFLDDDAIACPVWLEEISRAFESIQPPPKLVCGPVEPIWGAPRPAWLIDEFLGPYSVLDWSQTPRPLEDGEWIVGANFAVSRDILSVFGGFDERFGRSGKSLVSGEDTILTEQIRSAGHTVYYAPTIKVNHYIHPKRVSKLWFYRRVFWGATSRGIIEREAVCGPVEPVRYAFTRIKHLGSKLASILKTVRDPNGRVRWTRDVVRDLGRLYGFLFLGR